MYSHYIQAQEIFFIKDLVSQDSLINTVRILSGEDSVFIGGIKTKISERHSDFGTNKAADYIKEKFNEMDLSVFDQKYSATGRNIYAVQKGNVVPDSFYIICAHYDSVEDYCADDNASGTAAVLEAARILSDSCFRYSIIYALWDEEEKGLIGSFYFASQLEILNLKIKGVINLDMIGYDSNNDSSMEIHVNTDPKTTSLSNALLKTIDELKLRLVPGIQNPGTNGSDHTPFWLKGIGAVLIIEAYFSGDFNKFYHTANDRINKFNIPYFHEMSKLGIVTLTKLAQPCGSVYSGYTEPDENIFIFPNPTKGEISIISKNNEPFRLIGYDMFGKMLIDKKCQGELNFDIREKSDGIYFFNIISNNGFVSRKILKVN